LIILAIDVNYATIDGRLRSGIRAGAARRRWHYGLGIELVTGEVIKIRGQDAGRGPTGMGVPGDLQNQSAYVDHLLRPNYLINSSDDTS
jgi:hypothetical protein